MSQENREGARGIVVECLKSGVAPAQHIQILELCATFWWFRCPCANSSVFVAMTKMSKISQRSVGVFSALVPDAWRQGKGLAEQDCWHRSDSVPVLCWNRWGGRLDTSIPKAWVIRGAVAEHWLWQSLPSPTGHETPQENGGPSCRSACCWKCRSASWGQGEGASCKDIGLFEYPGVGQDLRQARCKGWYWSPERNTPLLIVKFSLSLHSSSLNLGCISSENWFGSKGTQVDWLLTRACLPVGSGCVTARSSYPIDIPVLGWSLW